MPSSVRGRSPGRVPVKTTPPKLGQKQTAPTKSPKIGLERDVPKVAGRNQMPELIEPEVGYQRKIRNTPEHLYGIDQSDDMLDDDSFRRDKQIMKVNTEKASTNDLGSKWFQVYFKKIIGSIVIVLIGMQAYLYFKGRDINFETSNLSADASICLRSHEELRKKLAVAFELINESGKLFKQLERQTKHEFSNMDTKLDSFNFKNMKELDNVKREMEAIKITHSFRDNVDFSKYAEKVFSIAKPLKAILTVESRFDPPYFMILNNECIYGMELPVDLSEVHSLVEMALLQYDADKIGIPDYALETAGGRIHVPYHSQTHSSGSPIMKVFGIVIWEETRTPREIIKPEVLPGNCWPMKGSSGYVVIKLAVPIVPSMVTMEHMHPSLSKFSKESWESVPRNFTVYAWLDQDGQEKVILGSYIYLQGSKARQTFPVQVILDQTIEYIHLQVESNYGSNEYTCIYRFRVHGSPLVPQQNNVIDID